MKSATSDVRTHDGRVLPVTAGSWRVDPSRSSASFTARVAGKAVRGRLPLSGGAYVSSSIEDSAAHLHAPIGALRTGSALLDRILAAPGFLDAEAHPDISFRSDMLVCVPTGWRAVGHLRVKGTDHPLVCELDADLRDQQQGPAAMTVTTRWVIDSTWITSQRVPMLARRIAMSCFIAFEPVDELDARRVQLAACG
jgi:polyisoprenoid-binding protein YceI